MLLAPARNRKIREDMRPIIAAATNNISGMLPTPGNEITGRLLSYGSEAQPLYFSPNGSPFSWMCRPSQSVRLFAQAMPLPPPIWRAMKTRSRGAVDAR